MPDPEKIREALARLSGEEREGLRRALLGWYADTHTPLVTVHVNRDGTREDFEASVSRGADGSFLILGIAVGDMVPTLSIDDDLPGGADEGE